MNTEKRKWGRTKNGEIRGDTFSSFRKKEEDVKDKKGRRKRLTRRKMRRVKKKRNRRKRRRWMRWMRKRRSEGRVHPSHGWNEERKLLGEKRINNPTKNDYRRTDGQTGMQSGSQTDR